jgi:oxaloacetate decarboxylase alpha subunit
MLQDEVESLRQMGVETVVNLIFSVSPRHTDEFYAQKAREVAALKPYRICFKDVGELLTPERTRALIPIIRANINDVPLEFHAHCNNGLAPFCYLEAIKLGVKIVHTAIPPLANGSSQPSVFNVASNARALGYSPVVDEAALKPVSEHFTSIAKLEGFPIGTAVEYDHSQYLHQVPGGMISNLRYQLRLMGMEHKLEATLEEAGRVRAEFGYPIMVTPLSQFVGSQAAINIILGERYKEGDRPDHSIRAARLGKGREYPDGPQCQGQDPKPAPGQGTDWLGTPATVPSRSAAPIRRARRF